MEAEGGGLPQRPPRSRKRPASAVSESAAVDRPAESACESTAELAREQPDAPVADRQPDGAAAEAAAPAAPAVPATPMQPVSDKHTSGALRSARVESYNFEWGGTIQHAFEQVALAMFNYMTPLSGIRVYEAAPRTYDASGHDMHSLLFNFLDELLFVFSTELFVPAELSITQFDRSEWRIQATGKGEVFDRQRHVSGTEVKAITYSAMDVREQGDDVEIFVIVDI